MNFNGFSDCLGTNMKLAMKKILSLNIASGCGIMIGRAGKLCYEGYEGFADIENSVSIDRDTVYRMYSNTKLVTAVAVLQLYEKSCFSLLDPLYKYIPEFREMTVQTESGIRPASQPILIKHLLTMTAGFGYDDSFGNYSAFASKWAEARQRGEMWNNQRFASEVAKVPLLFDPGTDYCYSIAYDILGALVEIWSGERFDRYCSEHIFKPLGMNNTSFSLADIDQTKLCKAYTYSNGVLLPFECTGNPFLDVSINYRNPSFFSGGAGLLSTLEDTFRFTRMLSLNGTVGEIRILGSRTVKMMSTPQLNGIQKKSFSQGDSFSFGEHYSYGMGCRVLIEPHTDAPSTVGEWGWSGALGTFTLIDPGEDMFYVFTINTHGIDHSDYVPYLNTAVYSSME